MTHQPDQPQDIAPFEMEAGESCPSRDQHCPHSMKRLEFKHGKYVPVEGYYSVFRCCQCGWWSVGNAGWTKEKP